MADRVVAGWLTGIGQTFEGLSEAVIPTFGEVCQAPLAPRLSHQLACELRLSCPQRAAARSPGQGPHVLLCERTGDRTSTHSRVSRRVQR